MPAPAADTIRQAVDLARSGNPSKGLELLLSAPASPADPLGPLYHYTAGNLYLAVRRPGEALAQLEFSQALSKGRAALPGLTEALASARTQANQKLGMRQLDRPVGPLEAIASHQLYLPLEVLVAVLALASALSLWRGKRQSRRRSVQAWAAAALWALALTLGATHWAGLSHPVGRLALFTELRSGPSEDFLVIGSAPAGAQAKLLEERSGWARVEVAPALSGWVESSRLLLLVGTSTTGH